MHLTQTIIAFLLTQLIYFTGSREEAIKRIQTEFGYSYDDAEKFYEIQKYKAV